MTKTYKKTHESKKALTAHIAKIEKRGGKYTVEGKTITYSFPEKATKTKKVAEKKQEVHGRGWGDYKKGKRITDIKELKVGSLYLELSKEFNNAKNIIKITKTKKVGITGSGLVYANYTTPPKEKTDFSIWDYELKFKQIYEIKK